MKREEAYNELQEIDLVSGRYESDDVNILLENIYDDFESRACANCKLLHSESNNSYCRIMVRVPLEYKDGFYCSMWEKRGI